MPLRVRCPECKTVLDVPTGSRPTCPKCGFAGRSAPHGKATTPPPQTGVRFSRTSAAPAAAAPAAASGPQAVEWQTEGADEWAPLEGGQGGQGGQADAWAPAEGEGDTWAPVEGQQGQAGAPPAGWPEAEDEWAAAEPGAAPAAAEPAKKKRRWGRKGK